MADPLNPTPAQELARQRYLALQNAAQTQPVQAPAQVAQEPGYLESIRARYGSANAGIDPAFTARREKLMAEYLRELDAPETKAPSPQFSQFYTPDFVKEQVNQLRGENTLGTLLAMSGDRALAPVGQEMMRSADPRKFMQEAANREQTRQYQQWQADYGARRDPDRRANALAKAIGMLDDGAALSQKGTQNDYQNVHAGFVKDLTAAKAGIETMDYLNRSFSPDYQKVLGDYQSVLGNVPATMVSLGLEQVAAKMMADGGPPEEVARLRASAQWWSDFKQMYETVERHNYYGAALTPSEKADWKQAMLITPSTSPEEVQKKLAKIDMYQRKAGVNLIDIGAPIYGPRIADGFEGLLDKPKSHYDVLNATPGVGSSSSPAAISHPKYGDIVVED